MEKHELLAIILKKMSNLDRNTWLYDSLRFNYECVQELNYSLPKNVFANIYEDIMFLFEN